MTEDEKIKVSVNVGRCEGGGSSEAGRPTIRSGAMQYVIRNTAGTGRV